MRDHADAALAVLAVATISSVIGFGIGSNGNDPATIGSHTVPALECAGDEAIYFDPRDPAPREPVCVHLEILQAED